MAKRIGYSDEDLKALSEYESVERFEPAVKAALKLAEQMTIDAYQVSDNDFAELRTHYSEPEIIEIGSVISMANYFNRFTTAMRIDLSGSDAPYESYQPD